MALIAAPMTCNFREPMCSPMSSVSCHWQKNDVFWEHGLSEAIFHICTFPGFRAGSKGFELQFGLRARTCYILSQRIDGSSTNCKQGRADKESHYDGHYQSCQIAVLDGNCAERIQMSRAHKLQLQIPDATST